MIRNVEKYLFTTMLVLAGVLFAKSTQAEVPPATPRFMDLFDGKSLAGWDGDPRFWRVEEGVIVGETTASNSLEKNTFLIHRGGEFDDFELRFSYQVNGYNSGVQYRSVDQGKWMVSGYQCDFEARWHKSKQNPDAALTDTFTGMFFEEKGRNFLGQRGDAVIVRPNPKNAKKALIEKMGSVGDPVELESYIKRDGWNELVVIANGNQFVHIINGHVMAVGIDEDPAKSRASGLFAFQLHKGPPMKIQLKDIRVRRLATSTKQAASVSKPHGSPTSVSKRSSGKNSYREYEQYALRHAGNPANGQRLFDDKRTNCIVCHKISGKGGDVGVDLSRIGGKFDRPHLIESLLEPSRQIVEGYRTASVVTDNGKVLSGIITQRSEQSITIVDANAKRHLVQRNDIEDISHSNVSIMPKGLANELSLDEFTDLIAYLESLRAGVTDKKGSAIVGPITIADRFELQTIATGLDGVTALDVLPDGRVLVCEQKGQVRVIENGKLLAEPFITLPVDAYWERGVIGVTHDPGFPKKPYIYVCWVAKEPYPHHRVSRFTMKGNMAKGNVAIEGSEKLLLVGDDQTKMGGKVPAGHQGGALHFGKDGKLYIGIGEQTSGAPAQKLDTFLGKILRINPDGSIPADNPFMDKAKGKYRAIWAYGARNPFTFAIRQSDGLMLINDVGGKSEEINVGRAGANYGWPAVEHGNMPKYKTDEFDGPIHWYGQSSLNGGDFCVTGNGWPKQWQGRYFFADYVQGWIRTLDPDSPRDVNTFVEGIRRPVDLRFAPDGSLYVLLRNAWVIDDKFEEGTGSLLRIHPSEDAPRAKINLTANTKRLKSGSNPESLLLGKVVLTEDAADESAGGLPAFKIETEAATYFLEKKGGGLSSLLDRDGNDWLGFHPKKKSGAGGEYRGFPNAVHQQQGSYFHASNASTDPMKSTVERVDEDYVSITVESETGHWAGRYEFFPTHCTFAITRVPHGSKYWVLYEGTPGGKLDLDDWWMTSAIQSPQPITKHHEGDISAPEWMAFGDASEKRSIVLINHQNDIHPDSLYQMNEQMTVFGFGRRKLEAFHSTAGQRFSIAIVESSSYNSISAFANNIISLPVKNHVRAVPQELGPKPGDVYREYAIHNGGNVNWRVTDPNTKDKRAQKFLPNPVLTLNVRDLKDAIRAEAVLDRWGGHAGTKDKKIRFNNNDWISLPELATTPEGHRPERYHSQDNPVIAVPLSYLNSGDNTIEGTIGPNNKTHWGQWGLYSLILRVYYDPEQKKFSTGKIISPSTGTVLRDNPTVTLDCDGNAERIDVLAWYDGYDEDGDGVYCEWHDSRFQAMRGQAAGLRDHVGTIDPSATARKLTWNTHWIPDQNPETIKLIAHIHDGNGLVFVTNPVERLSLKRDVWSVKQHRATEIPEAFSVRNGQSKSCNIPIATEAPLNLAREAVLHYRTWEADDGHHNPFQFNGYEHKNNGKSHHYDYDLLPIPVSQLKSGDNIFTIQSNTKHHMLEVLWPGPAITVRYRRK